VGMNPDRFHELGDCLSLSRWIPRVKRHESRKNHTKGTEVRGGHKVRGIVLVLVLVLDPLAISITSTSTRTSTISNFGKQLPSKTLVTSSDLCALCVTPFV